MLYIRILQITRKRLNNRVILTEIRGIDNCATIYYNNAVKLFGKTLNSGVFTIVFFRLLANPNLMSHKKAGGSTRLGRDSNAQRLGVKMHDGEIINKGAIIVRQRGTRFHPGTNVRKGKDDTLFAIVSGKVKFSQRKRRRFDGNMKMVKFASVLAA